MGTSVLHSLALSLAICFVLPGLSLSAKERGAIMRFHSAKDDKVNRWVSTRIDASSHIHIQGNAAPAPATDTSLADEPAITGPVPKDDNGNRWFASNGAGEVTAVYAFKIATQCTSKGADQCSQWQVGLNCDQMLTLAAVIQASKAHKAQWIMNKSVSNACVSSGSLFKTQSKQVSLLRTVETSRGNSEDTRVCIDPAVDDVEAWACECLDHAIDVCDGANEECFVKLLCENNEVCDSWKGANCAAFSLLASAMQQRTGVSSERPQANAPETGVDSSLAGSLQQPTDHGALIAAVERRTQVSKRSASLDGLDSTVQGKCTQ